MCAVVLAFELPHHLPIAWCRLLGEAAEGVGAPSSGARACEAALKRVCVGATLTEEDGPALVFSIPRCGGGPYFKAFPNFVFAVPYAAGARPYRRSIGGRACNLVTPGGVLHVRGRWR